MTFCGLQRAVSTVGPGTGADGRSAATIAAGFRSPDVIRKTTGISGIQHPITTLRSGVKILQREPDTPGPKFGLEMHLGEFEKILALPTIPCVCSWCEETRDQVSHVHCASK